MTGALPGKGGNLYRIKDKGKIGVSSSKNKSYMKGAKSQGGYAPPPPKPPMPYCCATCATCSRCVGSADLIEEEIIL